MRKLRGDTNKSGNAFVLLEDFGGVGGFGSRSVPTSRSIISSSVSSPAIFSTTNCPLFLISFPVTVS